MRWVMRGEGEAGTGAQDASMIKTRKRSERFNAKGLKKPADILDTRSWIAGANRNLLRSVLVQMQQ